MKDSIEHVQSSSVVLHDARNYLNRITMQTELAKLLLEQQNDTDKVNAALEKVLQACKDFDSLLSNQSTQTK